MSNIKLPALMLASAALVLAAGAPASAQLIERKDLRFAMALTVATAAMDACKAMGYATSVVVVDRGGDIMVAIKGDNAGPHTAARPAKVGTGFASGHAARF